MKNPSTMQSKTNRRIKTKNTKKDALESKPKPSPEPECLVNQREFAWKSAKKKLENISYCPSYQKQ